MAAVAMESFLNKVAWFNLRPETLLERDYRIGFFR